MSTTRKPTSPADAPQDPAPLQDEPWVAEVGITVDLKDDHGRVVKQLRFAPGEPCLGVPEDFPPPSFIERGDVSRPTPASS